MDGGWPREAADSVGNMTSLVGLALRYVDVGPLPADDAPVWAGLRALEYISIICDDEGADVPQALRRASKLEVLQVMRSKPSIQDMDVLASLPALRKLFVYAMPNGLPPSVRCVSVDEQWPQEAADVLGNMTSLVGLELGTGFGPPLLADDAPVWAGLRAFKGSSLAVAEEGGELPKALRRASKLEVLDMWVRQPSAQDVDLLTTLPALRKLFLYTGEASGPASEAILNDCRRAMPQVEVLLADSDDQGEAFFNLALASGT
ncbi:hypothetical protein N2152v2_000968 [Parachlorella kessleri]